MRDIRDDLKERLAALHKKTGELGHEFNRRQKEVEQWHDEQTRLVEDERRLVSGLLSIEMRRHGDISPLIQPVVPLHEFLVIETAKRGVTSKEDLRLAASQANYFNEGDSGGRAIHTTLLNLVRSGRIIEIKEGRYGVPSQDPQAARDSLI